MKINYFDAHTHTQFAVYNEDRHYVIERASALGVGMVNIGTNLETSKKAVRLANEYKDNYVYAAVGIHPIYAAKSFHDEQEFGSKESAKKLSEDGETFDKDAYMELADDLKVVAIGECGLDYFHTRDDETRKKQQKLFLHHVELSKKVGKPLMIHCRAAYDDLITILTEHKNQLLVPAGIIHFFSGTTEHAQKLLELGFYFTFGGVVTFTRDYDGVVTYIPISRILSETDAPYVTPVPHRGKRNEPSFVVEVAKKLADLKGVSEEEMAEQTLVNAERVFSIKLI